MLRFIICEDKQRDSERTRLVINRAMSKYEIDYRITAYPGLTTELERFIETNDEPKIYLLDIELINSSGIEVATVIRRLDWKSFIVFTTEFSTFKDEVYSNRIMAVDYISKSSDYENRLTKAIQSIYESLERDQILEFSYCNTFYRLPYKQITYIEKEQLQNKCIIHTIEGKDYPYAAGIGEIMKKLGSNFYQSHQSGIINTDLVREIDFSNNYITFKNDEKVNLLSERKKKGLKERAKHI